MRSKGTAVDSIGRRARLDKGYPLRDPTTQRIVVTREPPATTGSEKKERKQPVSAKEAARQRSARRKLYRERVD